MTIFDIRNASLYELLDRNRVLRGRFTPGSPEQAKLDELKRWQTRRLDRTYQDLRDRERYRRGVEFFLNQLYGEGDFAPRDLQLQRAYPIMQRMLPGAALHTLRMAAQLEVLSQELDAQMVEIIGLSSPVDEHSYAQAYRDSGRESDRHWQIQLLLEAGRDLDRLVHYPLIYGLIRMAHGPAHMAGFGTLHDFLEDGFTAFKAMGSAMDFLCSIERREHIIMQRILKSDPDPFRLQWT
jgi:hypothetical protein